MGVIQLKDNSFLASGAAAAKPSVRGARGQKQTTTHINFYKYHRLQTG